MAESDASVEQLENIGPTTAAWLHDIGIYTRADLQRVGAAMAYRICQHQRKDVNRLWLYALHGALDDRHFASYSAEEKTRMCEEAEGDFGVRYEA